MSQITLKHNVILEGSRFVPRGTVMDRNELPEHLRTPAMIIEGSYPDKIYDMMRVEEISGEDGPKPEELGLGMQEEELPQRGIKSKR
jgi:hypothetical protein